MDYLKANALPLIAVASIIVALCFSLEAAVTALAAVAAALFGDNKRKDKELTAKADLIRKVDEDHKEVIAELDRIERKRELITERSVSQREEEVDSWLDQ
jgi:hypothetical protein